MKKILTLVFFCAFALPIFAACKLDAPCTANILENTNQTILDSGNQYNLESELRTEVQQERNGFNNNSFINNPNPNYNANCQFGICLPERTYSEIIDVED